MPLSYVSASFAIVFDLTAGYPETAVDDYSVGYDAMSSAAMTHQ